jgi:hypothetical protein
MVEDDEQLATRLDDPLQARIDADLIVYRVMLHERDRARSGVNE